MAPDTAVTGTFSRPDPQRSKYLTPDVASEGERRFAVPDGYAESRVRVVPRDPHSLFAYWELAPAALAELRRELGSRLVAVSPVTLRLSDPRGGWSESVFVGAGRRSWYVAVDGSARTLRAEVGLTLPWGEFRSLATSRSVTPPRIVPAATEEPPEETAVAANEPPTTLSWAAAREMDASQARQALARSQPPDAGVASPAPASPVSRGGASEAFQGGASDRFHR